MLDWLFNSININYHKDYKRYVDILNLDPRINNTDIRITVGMYFINDHIGYIIHNMEDTKFIEMFIDYVNSNNPQSYLLCQETYIYLKGYGFNAAIKYLNKSVNKYMVEYNAARRDKLEMNDEIN